jgi:hypothetical protein
VVEGRVAAHLGMEDDALLQRGRRVRRLDALRRPTQVPVVVRRVGRAGRSGRGRRRCCARTRRDCARPGTGSPRR